MLDLLRRIVEEVSAAPTLGMALQLMVQRIKEALEAEACSIFLHDQSTDEYVLMATLGLSENQVGQCRLGLNNSLIGYVAKRGEPINLADATTHPKFITSPEIGEDRFKSFLGTPIIHQRDVLGVIIVQQEEARAFAEDEEALLITLSAQLAGVIAHAKATGVVANLTGRAPESRDEFSYKGVPGSPGVGIGEAVIIYPMADIDSVPDRQAENVDEEIAYFEAALEAARQDIQKLSKRMENLLPPEELALFDVYLRILDKGGLGEDVIAIIREGKWAQTALREAVESREKQFADMEDPYLRERADDIHDLGQRVLSHLQSEERRTFSFPENAILVGEDIPASALAEIPHGQLAGIVSGRGSRNSHVAILARAMGIPTAMGVSGLQLSRMEHQSLIVDGYHGFVYVSPAPTLLQEYEELAVGERELEAHLEELRELPAQTLDNYSIALTVNTGLVSDVSRSLKVGADGVGLYRSEIPFMARDRFPSEKEQTTIYRQLLSAFSPRPVIMRTLDVGGDKPLSYLPVTEMNPFLGWRGIRITLDHPEVFLVQLRAMLAASESLNNLRILLPMVTSVNEVDEAMRLLRQAHEEVVEEGKEVNFPPVGVMIEVPSAVYQARGLASRVDFLSVGTNDLTQYLLAVDRNNAHVANIYDSLHPAVLRALLHVVETAHSEGKVASVCGEMAGDPAGVILLLAMGYDSLSMSSNNLPRTKWVVRRSTLTRARELLQEVLGMEDAIHIRMHLLQALDDMGLGGLIRAGNR